jgi:hypothetical protein
VKETTNSEIGVAAYDAGEAFEYVQITFGNPPVRTYNFTRGEAFTLAERIKKKARTLAPVKESVGDQEWKLRAARVASNEASAPPPDPQA